MWGRRPGRYAHHHVPRKRNLRRKLLSQNDLFLRFADRLPRLPGGRRPLVTRTARPVTVDGRTTRPGLSRPGCQGWKRASTGAWG